jgi:hypothetical protein
MMSRLGRDELEALQNPENWEDEENPVRPPVKSPRAVVSVAFSREDFESIAAHAREHGMKTSEFIRRAALNQLAPKQEEALVSVTGVVSTGYAAVSAPRARTQVSMPEPPVYATT